MDEIKIEEAVYTVNSKGKVSGINATIDGFPHCIPMSQGNRHYDEIMRQVNAGTLTIQEAE